MGADRGNQSVFPYVRFISKQRLTVNRGSIFPQLASPHKPSQLPTVFLTPVRTHLPSLMGTLLQTLFPPPLGTLLGTPLQTPISQLCSSLSPALSPKCPKIRTLLPPPLQPHFILRSIPDSFAYICYLSKTELINIAYLKQGYPNNAPCLN